MHFEIFPEDDL